ncbi:MAG: hypothetical protein H7230_03795 [Candidatus Parcubacteria bacterium]|nr:hypothetical protein [Candidatus Paceibacterota bacterium]
MVNINHAFIDNAGNPVFAIPIISNIRSFENGYQVFILAITTNTNQDQVLKFEIIRNISELTNNFILKYPENLVVYGSEFKGNQAIDKSTIPTVLIEDFATKLFKEQITYRDLNCDEGQTSTVRLFYLKDRYSKNIIKVLTNNYCVVAYPT